MWVRNAYCQYHINHWMYMLYSAGPWLWAALPGAPVLSVVTCGLVCMCVLQCRVSFCTPFRRAWLSSAATAYTDCLCHARCSHHFHVTVVQSWQVSRIILGGRFIFYCCFRRPWFISNKTKSTAYSGCSYIYSLRFVLCSFLVFFFWMSKPIHVWCVFLHHMVLF